MLWEQFAIIFVGIIIFKLYIYTEVRKWAAVRVELKKAIDTYKDPQQITAMLAMAPEILLARLGGQHMKDMSKEEQGHLNFAREGVKRIGHLFKVGMGLDKGIGGLIGGGGGGGGQGGIGDILGGIMGGMQDSGLGFILGGGGDGPDKGRTPKPKPVKGNNLDPIWRQ